MSPGNVDCAKQNEHAFDGRDFARLFCQPVCTAFKGTPQEGLLPKYMRNNVAITVTYLVKSVPI